MVARPTQWLMVLSMIALAGTTCLPTAFAKDPRPIDGGGVTGLDLRTQLEKGLYARRPVEFEYIDEIVKLVEKKKLPRTLVTSTFIWARKRETRQLQYFQFALQARTRGLNIDMPDLRKQAVGVNLAGGEHGVNTPPIPPK